MFHNVTLSNLENVLQENLRAGRVASAFLEDLEAQILKSFPLSAIHGGAFESSMYVILVMPCECNQGVP